MCSAYPYGQACEHCGFDGGGEESPVLNSGWRLDRRRRAYRWHEELGEDYKPSDGWAWDGEFLRPVETGEQKWDWRRRRWTTSDT
jgi:hypothetical protein